MLNALLAQPSYVGQVATRCFIPDSTFASVTGWNARTAHYARDNITSLQVLFPNWYVPPAASETSQGGTKTITASIEYPAGTYRQLKFSGSTSIVTADGASAISDPLAVDIPAGALFFTKCYQVNAVGIQFCSAGSPAINLALGDMLNNTNADETLTASVDGAVGVIAPPAAIFARTRRPSIGIIGSSRSMGFKDATVDATGNTGYCRLFGDRFAYTNMAVSSDTMLAVTTSTKRLALLRTYCSHLWIDPGLNDLNGGASAATVLGYITSVAATWSKYSKVIVNDEGPFTTSTDSWSTTVNQTASALEAGRVALNTSIGGLLGYNQIVRVAALDTVSGSAFAWVNNGGAFAFTPDGIHENTAQLLVIKASNPFDAAAVR